MLTLQSELESLDILSVEEVVADQFPEPLPRLDPDISGETFVISYWFTTLTT